MANLASAENGKKGGRPKGSKGASTLTKELVRERMREMLTERLDPVADALVSRARGVRYFVTRNRKTGKYELVTNPAQVVAALNGEDEQSGEFYTDKPDVAAIKEIFDRTMDRSKDQVQEVNLTGQIDVIAILKQRHERNRA